MDEHFAQPNPTTDYHSSLCVGCLNHLQDFCPPPARAALSVPRCKQLASQHLVCWRPFMRPWEDCAFQEVQALVDLLLLRQEDGLSSDNAALDNSNECKRHSQMIEGLYE
jgi:hypothetical protein